MQTAQGVFSQIQPGQVRENCLLWFYKGIAALYQLRAEEGDSKKFLDLNHALNRGLATGPQLSRLRGSFSELNYTYKLPEMGNSGLKVEKVHVPHVALLLKRISEYYKVNKYLRGG